MNTAGAAGGIFGAFALVWLCFALGALLATVFWIWMLVECLTKEPDTGDTKLIWALVIIFTHGLGAVLYFFIRRPQRIAEQNSLTR
ncbi:MAG: PLDc_N domain-containing protein [Sandaracinaceae bacterium]|nr:PLDc_N domain-containing protein [Sandaracinaceae bacterium]